MFDISRGDAPPLDGKGSIGVVESLEAVDVVRLANNSKFSHVVQKNGMAFDSEMLTAAAMTGNVLEFLRDPLAIIFGPQPEEGPRDALHISNPVHEKKTGALDQFEEFLKSIKGARRIREQALLVADELYTNAIKMGHPHEKMSTATFARAGTVEFFAEHDGNRLVLGCRDSFGELGFGQVLTRIAHCFDKGVVHSINNGSGGAGIGSFMVFNTCISYYCGVDKGRTTVVCVALPLGVSDDELPSMPKNIHLVSA